MFFFMSVQMSATSFELWDFKTAFGEYFSDGVTSFKAGDFKSQKLVTRTQFWCTIEILSFLTPLSIFFEG